MIYVKDNNLEREVNEGKVLVDFFATWCGPCKMLGAELEDIVNSRGEIKIVKVDVDENPILAQQYGIMSVPTLLYFNNGKLVKKDIGFMPLNAFERSSLNATAPCSLIILHI